ncbi:MAG: phenylalanine--tRNA ligase subunit alpha [Elusimicrobiota bacterium]
MPNKSPESWESELARVAAEFSSVGPAAAKDIKDIDAVHVRFLGRKGALTSILKSLKDMPVDQRRALGPRIQNLKNEFETALERRRNELEQGILESRLSAQRLDVGLPADSPLRGRPHPLTIITQDMAAILGRMGFSWAEGPHVENERNNFEALNIPEHHPARDMLDTFYLNGAPGLLRTHTSPVQIRTMESRTPPLRVICPGRVFRHEEIDASHSSAFHQIEGLAVDSDISFADLKGTLIFFLKELFGSKTETRFRPSYFPFTEPSTEVDVRCLFCSGLGCGACKRSGWMEILGAGIVHPNVFSAVGYDPLKWSGFAFGIGVERVAMLRLGVPDMRVFYENDQRFLAQFDENFL